MPELVIELLRFIAAQLEHLDPKLSSAILGVLVLILAVFIWRPKPPTPIPEPPQIGHMDDVQSMRAEIDKLVEIIKAKDKRTPIFSTLEHIYFNTNGITNSLFVLTAALLVFEYASLGNRVRAVLPKSVSVAVADGIVGSIKTEVGLAMAILAGTVVICSLLVMIARIKIGRSVEIINRSFQLSMLVAFIAFLVFALPLSFPG